MTDAVRLARALMSTNAAVRKLVEAIPLLVVVPDDDPLARGLHDAATMLALADGIAERVERGATKEEA